jgi:hypothetical protein
MRKLVKEAAGEELRSLKTVPVRTPTFEPELLRVTSTLPTKSLTGLPETSRTETIGWVVKFDLLTAPVASVVKTSCVARPWLSSIVLVPVRLLGSRIVAVMVLEPVAPVSIRPSKFAAPELADRVVVPESVAPLAVRAMDWLPAVPVVTRFASAS